MINLEISFQEIGRNLRLEDVDTALTITELINEIRSICTLGEDKQIIIMRKNECLDGCATLQELKLQNWECLKVKIEQSMLQVSLQQSAVKKKIEISLKVPQDKTYSLYVNPYDKVECLKQLLEDHSLIKTTQRVQFYLNGHTLDPSKSMDEQGIQALGVLEMRILTRGAG